MKNNTKNTKKATVNASDIFAILRGEKPITASAKGAVKKPTAADAERAFKCLRAGITEEKAATRDILKKSIITTEIIEQAAGATDFDMLVSIADYLEGATTTKKCVRFKLGNTRFSCWRRVANIRIYTNNPDIIKGVDWVDDTHEQGLTHSGYTSFALIAKALVNPVLTAQ